MLRLMELRLKLEQGEAAFISFLQVTAQGAARGGAAGASKFAGLLRQQRHVRRLNRDVSGGFGFFGVFHTHTDHSKNSLNTYFGINTN